MSVDATKFLCKETRSNESASRRSVAKKSIEERMDEMISLSPHVKEMIMAEWLKKKNAALHRRRHEQKEMNMVVYAAMQDRDDYLNKVFQNWKQKKRKEFKMKEKMQRAFEKRRQREEEEKKKKVEVGERLYNMWLEQKENERLRRQQQYEEFENKVKLHVQTRRQLADLAFRIWLIEKTPEIKRKTDDADVTSS